MIKAVNIQKLFAALLRYSLPLLVLTLLSCAETKYKISQCLLEYLRVGDDFPGHIGSGTADDPYLLCTPQGLNMIRTNLDKYHVLDAHIDASQGERENFEPMGRFEGTLDGAGFAIKNLNIQESSGGGAALFLSLAPSGTIKNLGIENLDISTSAAAMTPILIGALVAESEGTIENCYAVDSDGDIDISGGDDDDGVGGLVGHQKSGSIISSYASSDLSGGGGIDQIGGLVGFQENGNITSSYASGTVDGGAGVDNAGGLVGFADGTGSITSSYAAGDVYGGEGDYTDHVGGLVGRSNNPITSSYAAGDVDGDEGMDGVGGLVGTANGEIIASYAMGTVKGGAGADEAGGLSRSTAVWSSHHCKLCRR